MAAKIEFDKSIEVSFKTVQSRLSSDRETMLKDGIIELRV